ncbi:MAG TPA: ABC transporter permease [Candidatus Limnocylindria bacterium]|nr:ABC transporter permease [Candidatus Limnocylindria bacterium]
MAENVAGGGALSGAAVFVRPPRSLWGDAWRQFRRHRFALLGAGVFLTLVAATLIGPFVYRVPIDDIDFKSVLKGPSLAHPFGTDELGRDLLARCLYGGRVSIAVGIAAVSVAMTVGTLIGALAGYFRRLDGLLMRITDLFISIPSLPLLLLVILLFRETLRGLLGPIVGIFVLIVLVIGLLNWMGVARLVRAAFLSLKEREFVVAARSVGAPDRRIIFGHILPNALGPVIVASTLGIGAAIITESSLSFLGLGFPPDEPTWGRLLFDAQSHLTTAPHFAIFPGALISLAVLSVNYIGDGLRDALDPRRSAS